MVIEIDLHLFEFAYESEIQRNICQAPAFELLKIAGGKAVIIKPNNLFLFFFILKNVYTYIYTYMCV